MFRSNELMLFFFFMVILWELGYGFEFRWYVSESKIGNGKSFLAKYHGIKF